MDGGHDFIGSCSTTLENLIQGEEFQIVQVCVCLNNEAMPFFHRFKVQWFLFQMKLCKLRGKLDQMKWLFTVILFNSLPYQSECLYIIYVHCTVISTKFSSLQLDLINPKKINKKGYENSGQVVLKSFKIEQVKSKDGEFDFLERICNKGFRGANLYLS